MSSIKNRQLLEEYFIRENATVTAGATSEWYNCEGFHNLRVSVKVTGVVSGTNPTYDVSVEAIDIDESSGTQLATLTQITATAASESKLVDIRGVSAFRIVEAIGGTNSPSFAGTDLFFALE